MGGTWSPSAISTSARWAPPAVVVLRSAQRRVAPTIKMSAELQPNTLI